MYNKFSYDRVDMLDYARADCIFLVVLCLTVAVLALYSYAIFFPCNFSCQGHTEVNSTAILLQLINMILGLLVCADAIFSRATDMQTH